MASFTSGAGSRRARTGSCPRSTAACPPFFAPAPCASCRRRRGAGVAHHLLHLRVRQTARALDGDLVPLLVALSRALTFTMPLASMSNVTSICGEPRAPADAHQVELPRILLSAAISLAPCRLDPHLRLVVRGGEGLRLLRGDGSVAADQAREHPTEPSMPMTAA